MDEIDLKLIKLLWENPRSSYRDLADSLNISTPAVHRRIQAAKETEILLGPFVYLSPFLVDAVHVIIIGHSQAKSLSEVKEALKEGDSVEQVTLMSGNYLMIRGKLKSLAHLDKYVDFVSKGAVISNPDILLNPSMNSCHEPKLDKVKMSKVDFKIISALRRDGRMPINEIAEEISVSPKTVRKHLNNIMEKRLVGLSFVADQSHSGDFVPMLQIYLNGDVEKNDIITKLINDYTPPVIEPMSFGNKPNFILAYAWLNNMAQLKELMDRLEKEDGVESVIPNIFVKSFMLETWLETVLDDPEKAYEFVSSMIK